jgi:hypothetical protein
MPPARPRFWARFGEIWPEANNGKGQFEGSVNQNDGSLESGKELLISAKKYFLKKFWRF